MLDNKQQFCRYFADRLTPFSPTDKYGLLRFWQPEKKNMENIFETGRDFLMKRILLAGAVEAWEEAGHSVIACAKP
jgi:hypothetical protein